MVNVECVSDFNEQPDLHLSFYYNGVMHNVDIKLDDGESILVSGSQDLLSMVILKSDNLTDLWAQRLVKFFGWNTREQNKPLMKKS